MLRLWWACWKPGDVLRAYHLGAGMLTGSLFVGVHMALTHGVTLGMVASYIPATEVEGIGRITGTCWSFTDFVFGELTSFCPSIRK
jgi:hypothetical protein